MMHVETESRAGPPELSGIPKGLRMPAEICLKALSDWTLFPRLLTVSEVAFLCGLSVKAVYTLKCKGVFEGVVRKIGKQLRFDRDALLERWTHARKNPAK